MNRNKKPISEMTPEEREVELKHRKAKERRHRFGVFINRIFGFFLATGIMVGIAGLALEFVLLRGPSPALAESFAMTMFETRRFTWVPNIFLSEEEVQSLKDSRNKFLDGEIDFSLISIPKEEDIQAGLQEDGSYVDAYGLVDDDNDGVIHVKINGSGYEGYMMVILDPTRVFVGMPNGYGGGGLTLEEMCKKYDAIGGINAGSFVDNDGGGNGGQPDGLTIVDGVCYQEASYDHAFVGMTEEGVMYVGYYDLPAAETVGIVNGCSFGPILVYNGEPWYNPSGLNPRTAIGQRGDGAILMLVIDGRQVHSIGASYFDLTDIMLAYGAVNAINLDGGSSSGMYYNGEYVNSSSAQNGIGRPLPTAFLFK